MNQAPGPCQLCQGTPDAKEPIIAIPHYGLLICKPCKVRNRLGWQPEHEPLLRQGLHSNGLFIPDRTPEGLLPFDYQPPSDHAI